MLKVERILLSFDVLDDGVGEDCFGSGGEVIVGSMAGVELSGNPLLPISDKVREVNRQGNGSPPCSSR